MADDDLGICHQVRKLREGALPYWRSLWEARTEERDFLDGDRYEGDNDLANRDRRRVQFRGQETSNVNRHKAAQATSDPRNLEARVVDRKTDPDDAEIAVSVMEWELGHPQKGFDDVLEEVVQDAVDCRAGAAILDFEPDLGQWGECVSRWKDANLLMFEPGFSDPHHLKCGWMQEARRMHMDEIHAMGKLKGKAKWYVPDELRPDGEVQSRTLGTQDASRMPHFHGSLLGVPDPPIDEDHVWVLFCWYKNDPSTYKRQADDNLIPEGQRYIGCDNPDCSYRSDTQDELLDQGKLDASQGLPDAADMPCPECGSPMTRRDVHATEDDVLVYPKGRRLVIMPLLQQLPDDEPFYDGGWPIPTARSFPLLWVTAYVKPGRPMGDSDTTRNWDAQLASDQLMTMAFDRMMRHQNYYVMPQVGVYDVNNERFEYRDDQFNVMFVDYSNPSGPPPMPQMIDGSSLDPAWTAYWQAVQNVLLSHQGINDLGLTPENSKNIAASTVAQLNQQGEIPVEHFKRRKNRALSKFFGVYWDYVRYTYPAQRLARLQIGDEYIVDKLAGDDLPNFDFVLSESPPFTGLEKARNEAVQLLMQTAANPATRPFLDIIAKYNNLPPSLVREFKRTLQEIEAQAPPVDPNAPQPDQGADMGGAPQQDPFAMLQQSQSDQTAGATPEVPALAAA